MSIYDGVSRANDTIDLVSGLISTKREFIVKQAANSILLFVILLVFGCLDFATLQFHGEYLLTASYWGTIVTKEIAAICALNIGINMMLDNEIKKSVELANNIETYNKLIKLKDVDFEYYVVHIFNPKIKIETYKNIINKKIYRLNKYSRRKDRLLYSSDLPERQEEKKHNRYCIKRAELEELKSDEYIRKNIDNIIIRYKEVDPAAFELEINGSTKSSGVVVSGNITRGRLKEVSSVMMGMLIISMLTTSFSLSADKQEFANNMVAFWHYCLKAMEDTGIILWQFINGVLRTRNIVSSQLTKPYAGRNYVLKEYFNWKEENNASKSPVFKELEEEIVEIKESEYKEIKKGEENNA